MGMIQTHCCRDSQIKNSGIIISKQQVINNIIKIQSYFRGFNFRRKNITLTKKKNFLGIAPTYATNQIKEISMNYTTESQDNNPKILKLFNYSYNKKKKKKKKKKKYF